MANLVLGAVGAAVGFYLGGPTGASIGFSLGSALGSTMNKSPTTKVQGQQQALMDLKITGTDYGQPIPYVVGSVGIAGQVWWNTDRRPTTVTTTTTTGGGGGGKGGGGGGGAVETSTSITTYDMDMLIGLTDNRITGISRIWLNGELIYTADPAASPGSITASLDTSHWHRMTVYTGDDGQMPDPTYEAAIGVGNAPAYRGRATVFIEKLQLGQGGQVPNLTFEIIAQGVESFAGQYAIWDGARASGGYIGPIYTTGGPDPTPHPECSWNFAGGGYYTGEWCSVVADQKRNVGPGNGVWYCEMTAGGNIPGFGIARSDCNITPGYILGQDETSYGFFGTWGGGYYLGAWQNHAGVTTRMAVEAPGYFGGIWGMSFDAVAGTLHLWHQGVDLGIVATGLTGAWSPAGMVCKLYGAAYCHMNSGMEPWVYTPHGTPWVLGGTVITKTPMSVAAAVAALCRRAGLVDAQFDVSALSTITRKVNSLAIAQIVSTRATLELLMSVYYFEMVVSDKLYFRPRGGASVATIPYEELGADKQDGRAEPLALLNANELEIPAQIALTYLNTLDYYQPDTQYSDRLITATAGSISAMNVAVGMEPAEAKAVADTMLHDQAASTVSTQIALLGTYCRLEPTDAVTVLDANGDALRLRLVKKLDSFPLLQFDAVVDDISILTSPGVTSGDYTGSSVVSLTPYTLMQLLDIPILRDSDNDAGFYVAAKGDGAGWPGAGIFNSADDVEYTRQAVVMENAVFGFCMSTLGDWSGGRMFDEKNSVTVAVADGTLNSTTRDAILNDQGVNAMLIGNELIQFRSAALVSAGVYKLTGLLRGSRGTEWASVGHVATERCVLLRAAGLRRIVLTNAEIGLVRYYKGITFSRSMSSDTARTFVDTAVGLKPFSPALEKAARIPGGIFMKWNRRSRLSVRMIGPLGISVPLGEALERYDIEIFDATFAALFATTNTTSPTLTFADGALPSPAGVKIYQTSEIVGRGYPLTLVI